MRVTRIITQVDVVGRIWQPGLGLCSATYEPREAAVTNADGVVDRESIQRWIDMHAGDFAEIVDFRATIGDVFDCDFANDEYEGVFNDCMYREEA